MHAPVSIRLRRCLLLCAVGIAGAPAVARAQFTYQAPQTSSQDTVGVWNDFNGASGTAPVSIYNVGSWQTVPWPLSAACGTGGLYSQEPSFSPSDWQLGTFQGRGSAYQITLGPGNTSITNNRLELNSSPGSAPPPGTANDSCHLRFEPASTCSVASGCISSAYFKWSTYISSTALVTQGLTPNHWGGDLFQMHPMENAGGYLSGSWPQLAIELDGTGTPYFAFAVTCTAGTPGCVLLDPADPNTTAFDWRPNLSPGYVGRWVDFAFYIKLSTGSDGVQTLWVDGQQVATWNGPNMYASASGHPRLNLQHGLYRLSTATSTLPLYQTPMLYSTTTPTAPPNGPAITSGPSATPGSTSATITWTTDVASTSQVDYGTSPTALTNSTPLDSTAVTSHSVQLSGLSAQTTYSYLVRSSTGAGTTASAVFSFTTGSTVTTGTGSDKTLWTRQFGSPADEYAYGVAADGSGNVYVTGYTRGALGGANAGGQDVFLMKLTGSTGAPQWTSQTLKTTGDDFARAVAVDPGGNVYVVGSTTAAMWGTYHGGLTDGFLARFAAGSTGAESFSQTIGTAGDDVAYAVTTDAAGNVYVAGSTTGAMAGAGSYAGGTDGFLTKFDVAQQSFTWTAQIGTSGDEVATGVAVDSAGNIVVVGTTTGALAGTNGGLRDVFLAKYAPTGSRIWLVQRGAAVPGTSGDDEVNAVAIDSANNIYVAGATTGSIGFTNQGGVDAFVLQYTSNGGKGWSRQLGTASDEWGYGIATNGSDVFMTGTINGGGLDVTYGGYDVFTAKYSNTGTLLWKKTLGSPLDEIGRAAAVAGTDGVYVVGGTFGAVSPGTPNAGGKDIIVSKYAQ